MYLPSLMKQDLFYSTRGNLNSLAPVYFGRFALEAYFKALREKSMLRETLKSAKCYLKFCGFFLFFISCIFFYIEKNGTLRTLALLRRKLNL